MKTKAVDENQLTSEEQAALNRASVEETLVGSSDAQGPILMEPITIVVRRQYKLSGDLVVDPEEEVEEIAVQGFHTEPAHVGLRINHTNNMGNFWSLSVQVSMDTPCYREEHAEAWEFVTRTLTERLGLAIAKGQERVQELRKPHQGSGRSGSGSGSSHPF